MSISRVSNHPVHMVDEEGNVNPSSFIPFCSFGDNQFFNNLSDYNPELGMPVCDKFSPTLLDGRLCYRVTMDSFGQDITTQSGRGSGFNFIMDYNAERMEQDIEQQQHIENREAMIYIETIGNKTDYKLGLSSAKLSRAKFGCIEVMFEVVSKDNLN